MSDIDLMKEPTLTKKNNLFVNLLKQKLWTGPNWKKEELVQLKSIILGHLPDDYMSIQRKCFNIEEILLLSRTYQVNGEKYSSIRYKFVGNWCVFSYAINYFVEHVFTSIITLYLVLQCIIGGIMCQTFVRQFGERLPSMTLETKY